MAKFNFETLIKFKEQGVNGKIISLFRIKMQNREVSFQIAEKDVALKIYEILKKKLNITGFHKTFQGVKLIGSGNFAKVLILIFMKN